MRSVASVYGQIVNKGFWLQIQKYVVWILALLSLTMGLLERLYTNFLTLLRYKMYYLQGFQVQTSPVLYLNWMVYYHPVNSLEFWKIPFISDVIHDIYLMIFMVMNVWLLVTNFAVVFCNFFRLLYLYDYLDVGPRYNSHKHMAGKVS